MTTQRAHQEPPPGWQTFGYHIDHDLTGLVFEFSEETDPDDGLPLWERLVPAEEDSDWSAEDQRFQSSSP